MRQPPRITDRGDVVNGVSDGNEQGNIVFVQRTATAAPETGIIVDEVVREQPAVDDEVAGQHRVFYHHTSPSNLVTNLATIHPSWVRLFSNRNQFSRPTASPSA